MADDLRPDYRSNPYQTKADANAYASKLNRVLPRHRTAYVLKEENIYTVLVSSSMPVRSLVFA